MCGIAGFCNYNEDFTEETPFLGQLARRMGHTLRHRGPDESGVFVSNHAAFAHQRFAVIDPKGGKQPMTAYAGGYRYTIVYDGELYNADELRRELETIGYLFETKSDTETLLKCYIHYGAECPKKLNGIFAFAIDDEKRNRCFLCRDRFGVKPLFFTQADGRLVFGSELKALFQYPGIHPVLDRQSLCEIFGLGPSHTAGIGVLKGIYEIKPGYFTLFKFTGNSRYFQPTALQPDTDSPWAEKMAEYCGTNHTVLKCDNLSQADKLYDVVDARDMPGMADVDSSFLHFLSLVKKEHSVAISGDCADDIFGGYPWFCQKRPWKAHCFPWSHSLSIRTNLIKPEINDVLNVAGYVHQRYEESLAEVPKLENESPQEARRREIFYLDLKWFMRTLLERDDRMGMASGLEVRIPYADHRIVEYVFNVPWNYKCHDGVVKGLLRDAARPWLPDKIRLRRKCPYPKTCNPAFERILRRRFDLVIKDREEPLHPLIDSKAADHLLHMKFDPDRPWFGQLMAGTQMIAYLLQINYWLKTYEIEIEL